MPADTFGLIMTYVLVAAMALVVSVVMALAASWVMVHRRIAFAFVVLWFAFGMGLVHVFLFVYGLIALGNQFVLAYPVLISSFVVLLGCFIAILRLLMRWSSRCRVRIEP